MGTLKNGLLGEGGAMQNAAVMLVHSSFLFVRFIFHGKSKDQTSRVSFARAEIEVRQHQCQHQLLGKDWYAISTVRVSVLATGDCS